MKFFHVHMDTEPPLLIPKKKRSKPFIIAVFFPQWNNPEP